MGSEEFQTARGTRDVLSPETWQFEAMRRLALRWAVRYGYELIETPIFEKSPVFLRVGASTDIVQHERYQFVDAGGDDLTLRPEGTAAVARAYVQHGLASAVQPVKLCYYGPMFRRERPQAGRFRQHTQFGVELFGSRSPLADAEVMLLGCRIVDAAGLRNPEIRVNSLGCDRCRPQYRRALVDFFTARREELCQDCQTRLEQNPLRLLDCKVDVAVRQEAPDLENYWCDDCRAHITTVIEIVAASGQIIRRDRHLVRGLDYYTRTVFEVGHPGLGDQVALFGGGRYDGLTANLGGESVPSVGFGMGIERLLSALPTALPTLVPDRAYVAHLPGFERQAYLWALKLRDEGIAVDADMLERSLKAQLKEAGRRARLALIVGGTEWSQGNVAVRDLTQGSQDVVALEEVVEYMKTRLQEGEL
ncbi:MAG: histidine--tRNA ligase [Sulfobacillus acidophilus]|uniref:Histidine--tRNA ligase n=1 Tax=Sulfobacillus acidophilus TaxID=53633 RepID=A0A2T2WPD4_9FIRM|nr:MAG: histidine--tRNA ligase [Sulfobacillus acidophilus]